VPVDSGDTPSRSTTTGSRTRSISTEARVQAATRSAILHEVAMQAFRHLPRRAAGIGIVHQVNLEYSRAACTEKDGLYYPTPWSARQSHAHGQRPSAWSRGAWAA